MKETIIIEQFDNGITIKATNDEGTERRAAMDHQKEQEIGKTIWDTVKFLMDKNISNCVEIEIKYHAFVPKETDGINAFEDGKIHEFK